MHEVELAIRNSRAELTPDLAFKRIVSKRRKSCQSCPAYACAAAKSSGEFPNWGGYIFVVDGRKVVPFHQRCSAYCLSIADMRYQVSVGESCQCTRKAPPYQGDAYPFRVGSFGYKKYAIPTTHRSPKEVLSSSC